jgi:hypothetical protein
MCDDFELGNSLRFFGRCYVQLDKSLFDKLILNVGMREEFYQLDTIAGSAVPIFKGGLNYKVGQINKYQIVIRARLSFSEFGGEICAFEILGLIGNFSKS